MLAVDGHRIGLEQAGQAQGLVDLVEVVHPVVVADHLAHARTAAADQTVVGFAAEGQRAGAHQQVAGVKQVGQRAGAAPGVVAHAVHAVGAFAAGAGGNALRELGVEARRALAVERLQRAEGVLRGAAGAAGEKVDQRAEAIDDARQQRGGDRAGGAVADALEEVGGGRALVRRADAGDRGDQVRAHGGDVAGGGAAVAVADQVDLGLAADGDDVLDLLQQLLAARFGGVQLADLGDVDAGAVAAQGGGNAVPVVDAEDAVEAEHAVAEDDGVLGLGIAGRAEPEGLGLAAGEQAGAEAEGEQGLVLVHGRSRWVC